MPPKKNVAATVASASASVKSKAKPKAKAAPVKSAASSSSSAASSSSSPVHISDIKFTKTGLKALVTKPTAFLEQLKEDDLIALYQNLQYAYYNSGKPLVSDDIFDIVQEYIKKRFPKHAILKSIGAHIGDDDKRKEVLPVYMGSLDKVKSDPKQLDSFKVKYPGSYVVSDKLDGISALLVYESASASNGNNASIKLFTRGDGKVGQNISHLVPFINGIPATSGIPGTCIVRGELIMTRDAFTKYGKGANARNTIAGLVNAKVPDLQIAKNAAFVAYTLIEPVKTPREQMSAMAKMNFRVVPNQVINGPDLTFEHLSELLATRRMKSDYEIDGLVVSHDLVHPLVTGKNPDTAFAFKHLVTLDTAEVIVTEIVWSLSKDGLLKPVVEFGAVRLTGVSIKRATGFNAEYIKSNKIGPGARLLITRSGDVIPYIMQTLAPAASGEGALPDMPPAYIWVGKDIKVVEKSDGQDMKQLENFFDKVEIKGMRGGIVKKLYEDAGIKSAKEFLHMKEADIATVAALKNKWPLILEAKEKIRNASCVKLMQASNMFGQGFGERKLKAITVAIPAAMSPGTAVTVDELRAVEGVSTLTAGKFITGLAAFRVFMKDIGLSCGTAKAVKAVKAVKGKAVKAKAPAKKPTTKKSGASSSASKVSASSASSASNASTDSDSDSSDEEQEQAQTFAGQVIVFTGFRNKVWEAYVEERGGSIGSGVTKSTTLVVAKDAHAPVKTGKVKAAEDKGIRLVDMEEFEAMMV